MSGPCTLEYLLIKGSILGAIAALESAREIHAGLADAARDAAGAAAHRAEEKRSLLQRERAAADQLARRIATLEAGLRRLTTLAEALRPSLLEADAEIVVVAPEPPAGHEPSELRRYADALDSALEQTQKSLAEAGAKLTARSAESANRVDPGTLDRLANPRSLADLVDAYAEANRQSRAAEKASAWQVTAKRLLEPLEAEGGVSPEIEALLRELAGTPGEGRADALQLQLRHAVSAERARREAAKRQRDAAERLVAELGELDREDEPTRSLRQTLELAAAGLVDLSEDLTTRARRLIAESNENAARATQAAAARVLEGTLKDLGFVVEPIAETLFIEGGVAHFTRPEWGDYAVRLRAASGPGTLNFNVVREPDAAAADPVSTQLRDMRAEETWCAHIPRLQQALEARGIRSKVTRRLAAGEAPAQVVPAESLQALRAVASAEVKPAVQKQLAR